MKKFEIGKKYYCKSICNSDTVWNFTIIKRTDKSVWLDNGKRFNISIYDEQEMIYPLGKYSMCPVLKAGRMVA